MPVIDYLVLVPLDQEWEQVRMLLPPRAERVKEVRDRPQTYLTWTHKVRTAQYSGEYLVAATRIAFWTPGTALTSAVTANALERWQPRGVVLVGIAGSIDPATVRLGDVVVGAHVFGYEITDVIGNTWKLRRTFDQPSAVDLNRAGDFQKDAKAYAAWREACLADAANHGLSDIVKNPPTLHLGVIGSGNLLVRSAEFGDRLKAEIDQYIVAVEMEARAVHQAVYVGAHHTDALTIRGISDYADLEKDTLEKQTKGGWRTWAAANAARMVKAMLQRGTVAPLSPSYALNLERGSFRRFLDRDAPRISFDFVGSQDITFTDLLRRGAPNPDLLLDVSATSDAGDVAAGFRGVCVIETPDRHVVDGKFFGKRRLRFSLPASDWGLNVELFLSFPTPVKEIAITCSDEFGRRTRRTLPLRPPDSNEPT